MSYCTSCGRKEIDDHCTCLQRNPITSFEAYGIYFFLMIGPILTIGLLKNTHHLFSVSLFLSFFLIALTLIEAFFHRNYLALFFGCHQKSNRSFTFHSYTLPLCSRCTGIYLGVFLFTLLNGFIILDWYIYLLLGIPLIIDGSVQKYFNLMSTNLRRLITGILFSGIFIYLFSGVHELMILLAQWIKTLLIH